MAILFDFNGTMFFDEEFQRKSWMTFIEQKINSTITDEEFKQFIHGRNADFTMEYFLKKSFARDEIEALEEEKESIYRRLCLASNEFKLAPGLVPFLNELKSRKIEMNIATASGWNNVEFFFNYLHLEEWFDIQKVVYNDGSCNGKPEPDMYLKAAENIGVTISECYIFEDSKSGIEAAKRAKAKGVVKVLSVKENAEEIDADFEISTFDEIYTDSFLKNLLFSKI